MPPYQNLRSNTEIPSGLFPIAVLAKALYNLLSPIRATLSAYLILLYFITRILLDEQYKSWRSSLCSLLSSTLLQPRPSEACISFLDPLLEHPQPMFLPHKASPPYKITGTITVLYILIFIFLYHKLVHKKFCIEWYQAFHDVNLLLIYS